MIRVLDFVFLVVVVRGVVSMVEIFGIEDSVICGRGDGVGGVFRDGNRVCEKFWIFLLFFCDNFLDNG